jgi:orotate phosphoribosyltransferase
MTLIGRKKKVVDQVSNALRERLLEGATEDQVTPDRVARELVSLLLAPNAITDGSVLRELVKPPLVGNDCEPQFTDYLLATIGTARAMYRGHFSLLSGLHSEFFLIFNRIGSLPDAHAAIVDELAKALRITKPDMVIGPVSAGGLLVHGLADTVGARAGFFDLDSKSRPMATRVGYDIATGSRVVLVNDLATTGTGLEYMRRILESYGARLVGVGLFATRGRKSIQYLRRLKRRWQIPIQTLVHLNIEAFPPHECQGCEIGAPIPQESCMLNW